MRKGNGVDVPERSIPRAWNRRAQRDAHRAILLAQADGHSSAQNGLVGLVTALGHTEYIRLLDNSMGYTTIGYSEYGVPRLHHIVGFKWAHPESYGL